MAEDSLRWPVAVGVPPFVKELSKLLPKLLMIEAKRFKPRSIDPRFVPNGQEDRPKMYSIDEIGPDAGAAMGEADADSNRKVQKDMALALHAYASENAAALLLKPGIPIQVAGFNAVFRTGPTGGLLIELVAQFVQNDPQGGGMDAILGGISVKGGTTIVVNAEGVVRYAIAKPLPGGHLSGKIAAEAAARPEQQAAFVASLDARDALFPYMTEEQAGARMRARMSLRSLHSGIWP